VADQATAQPAPRLTKEPADLAPGSAAERSWSGLWQMPVILLSIASMVGAILYARNAPPPEELAAILVRVESLIAAGELPQAITVLEQSVAPWIDRADSSQQGRFHALAADSILGAAERHDSRAPSLLEAGIDHATCAVECGFALAPDQIERLAAAEFAIGRIDVAHQRLAALERMATDPVHMAEAQPARRRLLRRMIAMLAGDGDASPESALTLLDVYRADPDLATSEEIWAAARAAEMSLEAGHAREAVDRLMLDLRRLESDLPEGSDLGELLGLLARCRFELGDLVDAEEQCKRALAMIGEHDPRRAAALVTCGWILTGQSRFDEALQMFTTALEEFPGGSSHAAALLGRAEMHGVLGHHEPCMSDYRALAERFRTGQGEGRLTAARAVTMLAERRHDGALAMGDLDLALEYISLAAHFLPIDRLPEPVLARLGSTNRMMAERLLAPAGSDVAATDSELNDASRHFRTAADAFRALAAAREAEPGRDESWLEALWLAADSEDMSGAYDSAVALFERYRSWQTMNDSRGLEAAWRTARCHLAAGRPGEAAALYEGIIARNPAHPMAAASFVPLSRCHVVLGRPDLAEEVLQRVVSGGALLEPAAIEYRKSVIALADLTYGEGRFREAIEHITEALARYPGDSEAIRLQHVLAASYLGNARLIAESIQKIAIGNEEVESLQALRDRHLREAGALFTQLAELHAARASDPAEREQYVRAIIGRADCAFDLGDFETAIDHYEKVAAMSEHPSSLIALIQIVNCSKALGDRMGAEAAHFRALERIGEFPAAAFDEEPVLFDEAAWTRWLQGRPPGSTAAAASAVSAPPAEQ